MSSKQLTAQAAKIFRIVHRENLAKLLDEGCSCRSAAKAGSYVEIGNPELISRRQSREVPCGPGGTLSDYVPFYFTPYSPMLYNIKTGYNGITKRPMSDILILTASLIELEKLNIPFVYSDRHAYLKTAQFSTDLSELSQRIAWPALQSRDFSKSDVDRFEKYQAEALIHKLLPLNALSNIMCHDDSVKNEVSAACSAKKLTLSVINGRAWYL